MTDAHIKIEVVHVAAERIKAVLESALPADTKSRLHMIDTFYDNCIISSETRAQLIAWSTGNPEPSQP